ncbi:MAG: hypothetical protein WAM44_04435, partial [Chthoniobacterales bacterium]
HDGGHFFFHGPEITKATQTADLIISADFADYADYGFRSGASGKVENFSVGMTPGCRIGSDSDRQLPSPQPLYNQPCLAAWTQPKLRP